MEFKIDLRNLPTHCRVKSADASEVGYILHYLPRSSIVLICNQCFHYSVAVHPIRHTIPITILFRTLDICKIERTKCVEEVHLFFSLIDISIVSRYRDRADTQTASFLRWADMGDLDAYVSGSLCVLCCWRLALCRSCSVNGVGFVDWFRHCWSWRALCSWAPLAIVNVALLESLRNEMWYCVDTSE